MVNISQVFCPVFVWLWQLFGLSLGCVCV